MLVDGRVSTSGGRARPVISGFLGWRIMPTPDGGGMDIENADTLAWLLSQVLKEGLARHDGSRDHLRMPRR